MTFYDMLRRMIELGPYNETERTDFYAIVANMEHTNSFGGIAVQEVKGHECIWNGSKSKPACLYCKGAM